MTNLIELTPDHAALCTELCRTVGWQHTVDTWRNVLSLGQGFGMVDGERLIGTALAIPYGLERAWLAMIVTHIDYQRRGIGKHLTELARETMLEQGVREVCLDATNAGRPVYEKVGFRAIETVNIYQGEATDFAPDENLRLARPDDLPQLIQLDAAAFGVARPHIVERYFSQYQGWVDDQQGEIRGCILPITTFHTVLGMFYHHEADGAARLLKTALHHHVGQAVRLDVPAWNPVGNELALVHGLLPSHSVTRMIYGDADYTFGVGDWYYGITALALG